MRMRIGLMALGLFALAPVQANAAPAGVGAFCRAWLKVCNRSGDSGICSARHRQCLSSGCFHFNVPRPRCLNNAADRKLTGRIR